MAGDLTVGFIGVGTQGAPLARRIVDAGWPLWVWAKPPTSLEPFVGTPTMIADSAAELAGRCDVLCLCVNADDDVRDVLLTRGALAAMKPDSVVVIHSTVLPETAIEFDAAARALGLHLLDAPVSGGPTGARAGTMSVMVGGEAAILARVRPIFETHAASIVHLGPVGAGLTMKLLNNNLTFATLVMTLDALELAVGLGMDRDAVAGVLMRSSSANGGLRILTDETLFAKITGPVNSLAKDVHHLAEVARQRGLASDLLGVTATTPGRLARFARETGRA